MFSVNNSFWESAGAWLLFQLHAYPCSTFFSLEAFADPSTGSTIHIYYQFTQKVYLHQTKEHTLKFSKRSSVLQIAIIMLLLEERDPRGGSLWQIHWLVSLDDLLLRPPSKMKGEDVEDFSNPNLVDSTFGKVYFPNFDSHRVQIFGRFSTSLVSNFG